MNGNCCNLWRKEIKGISGWRVVYISYFKLFTLSFCLLHQSSGILLAPNFPLPQFRERRRAGGRGSLHGTKTLMLAAYVTSSTHLIFTLNKHNIHLICISSISLLQFIKCTPGGAKVEKQRYLCAGSWN